MKRPFATVGFTIFSVLALLVFIGSSAVAYYVLFPSFAIGVFSLLNKNLRQAMTVPVCLFTAVSACFLFLNFNSGKLKVQSFAGQSVNIEATVCEAPYMNTRNERHYCILELNSIEGEHAEGRLRLSFSPSKDEIDTDDLKIGNRLSFTAKVYLPGESEKSISRYFTGENIFLGAYSAEISKISEPSVRGVTYYFHRIRVFVTDKICCAFPDKTAGLLVGILTGDKSCLDTELYEAFRKTGLAHIMAVSGLHLSIWVLTIGFVIPVNEKYRKLRSVILILSVLFVMLLSGMSESVKRSGFMLLVLLSGELVKRKADSLNSLGFAILVMLLYNPGCVMSTSLQLSFLSTLGILTLGKLYIKRVSFLLYSVRLNRKIKSVLSYFLDMFFISISVLVFTFPVLIYTFNGFSAVSAWVNILISPFLAPLLLLAGVYVVLVSVHFPVYPIAFAVQCIADYIIAVTGIFLKAKNAFITCETENILLFALAFLIIICISFVVLKRKYRGKIFLTVMTVLMSTVLILYCYFTNGYVTKIYIEEYNKAYVIAVESNKNAIVFSEAPSYENSLLVTSLADRGISVIAEAECCDKALFKSTLDGKTLSGGYIGSLFGKMGIKGTTEGKIIEIYGKNTGIFYSDALQYEKDCDIIIEMLTDDVKICFEDKRFLFSEHGGFTLIFTEDGSIILRGENSWRNLMKSNSGHI